METVTIEIEIDEGIAAVFARLTDVENNRDWMQSVKETRVEGDQPLAEDSCYVESGSFLGKTITDTKRITKLSAPERFAYSGDFVDNAADFRLEAVGDDKTMLRLELSAEPPSALPGIAKRQIMKQTKKQMEADLQRFKQLVERQRQQA